MESKMKKYATAIFLSVVNLVPAVFAAETVGKIDKITYCAEKTSPTGNCEKGILKVGISNGSSFWFDLANANIDSKLTISILLTAKSTGGDVTIEYDPSQPWFHGIGRLQSVQF
jgi:hypothetical protein